MGEARIRSCPACSGELAQVRVLARAAARAGLRSHCAPRTLSSRSTAGIGVVLADSKR